MASVARQIGEATSQFIYFLIVVSVLGTIGVAVHNFHHSRDRYLKDIERNRPYVEDFCSNYELVYKTGKYKECEEARAVVGMDANFEALVETLESMQLCANPKHVHRLESDYEHAGDAEFTHCAHAYYIAFGAVVGVFVVLVALRCCMSSVIGGGDRNRA